LIYLGIALAAAVSHAEHITLVEAPSPRGGNPAAADVSLEIQPSPSADINTADSVVFILNIAGVSVEEIKTPHGDYSRLSLADEFPSASRGEVGRPDLPAVHRLFVIPDRKGVRAEIVAAEWRTLRLQQPEILPFQSEETDEGGLTEIVRDEAIYSSDQAYPQTMISLGEPIILRDLRLMRVAVCPFRYHPLSRELQVCSRATIRLRFEGEDLRNVKVRRSGRISRPFQRLYSALIPNYPGLEQNWEISDGSYLILCPDQPEVLSVLGTLVDWKRRKGYAVNVQAFPPGYSAVQIKELIQNAYNNSEEPPTYVLLIGDTNGSISLPGWSPSGIDHPYAQLEGDDILADVNIGRLPAATTNELAVMVSKIYHYEEDPYIGQSNWFTHALLIAGSSQSGISTIQTKRWVKDRLLREGFTQIDTLWYTMPGSMTGQMTASLNAGVNFFNYRGLYGMSGWSNAMTDALTNGFKLPIVTTITCGTGGFDGESIMEHLVASSTSTANLRGAVACVGTATTSTHTRFNNCVDQGFYWGLLDLNLSNIGSALTAAKVLLYQNYPNDPGNVSNFSLWNALAGDPGLEAWLGVPQTLEVIAPETISPGQNWVPVIVQYPNGQLIEDAWVSLYREGQVAVSGRTDAQGRTELILNGAPTGALNLTVTGFNLKPYRGTINLQGQDLFVGYQSASVDDDGVGSSSGDGDGIANPNETLELSVILKNFGTTATAVNVQAIMLTSDPYVTLLDSTAAYPDLPPQATASGSDGFVCSLLPDIPDGYEIQFQLLVNSALADPCNSGFTLNVVAPTYQYQQHEVMSGSLQPGGSGELRVTIRNEGHKGAPAVSGTLISADPFLLIVQNASSYGNIVIGGSAANAVPFRLNVHPLTLPGHAALLQLLLEDANGIQGVVPLTINLGSAAASDPAGPDQYGYYCFDNTDAGYDQAPHYDWVEIAPEYGGSGVLVNLNDYGDQQDDTEIIPLPFSFRYYGTDYDEISVCSNGWLTMGGNAAFTYFRNWLIPSGMGPDAMVAPFWDDLYLVNGSGVYRWYDAENGRFIVEWSRLKNRGSPQPTETFEVIFRDPAVHPTTSGDGDILFQYHEVQQVYGYGTDNPYASVGIESPDQSTGVQVSYMNQYPAGIAPLQAQRAYLFTTNVVVFQGSVVGAVRDLETGVPLPGAAVAISGTQYGTTADSSGSFEMDGIFIGTYDFTAQAPGYNPQVIPQVTVYMDSTVTLDFALTHPEISLDVEEISVVVNSGDSLQMPFHILNEGNGPLTFQLDLTFQENDESDELWAPAFSFPAQVLSGDNRLFGVEFLNDFFYVSGGNGSAQPNLIHRFDRDGNYLDSFAQPGGETEYGFRDLATDGNALYGSEGRQIVKFSTQGEELDRFSGPLNPNRALAFDPETGHLWVADFTSPIYEITLNGTVLRSFPNPLHICGLSWYPEDPDGRKLYLFSQDGSDPKLRISKMNTQTGVISFAADLEGNPSESAGGAAITPGWNPLIWTLVTLIQGPEDRLAGWELNYNTLWITYAPHTGEIPPGGQGEVQLTFLAGDLAADLYRVNLRIQHNAAGDPLLLPLSMRINPTGIAEPAEVELPNRLVLESIHPNPFNAVATMRLGLPSPLPVRWAVYDVLGRKVDERDLGILSAGWQVVAWRAEPFASGIYFLQVQVGTESRIQKCLLIK
jgi:hypothetical protein